MVISPNLLGSINPTRYIPAHSMHARPPTENISLLRSTAVPQKLTETRASLQPWLSEMLDFDRINSFTPHNKQPTSPVDGVSRLNRAVFDALNDTTPKEPDAYTLFYPEKSNLGPFPEIGSDEWFEYAKKTGVFIPPPAKIWELYQPTDLEVAKQRDGTEETPIVRQDEHFNYFLAGLENALKTGQARSIREYEDIFTQSYGRIPGRNDDGEHRGFRAVTSYLDIFIDINREFNQLIANNASQEELAWLARSITTGTIGLRPGARADDSIDGDDFLKAVAKGDSKLFGSAYQAFKTDPKSRKAFLYFDNDLATFAGESFAEMGIKLLHNEANNLDLEFFKDTEQYKVDVNIAIAKFSRSIQLDMLRWSSDERNDFDIYISNLRASAVEYPKETLALLQEKL